MITAKSVAQNTQSAVLNSAELTGSSLPDLVHVSELDGIRGIAALVVFCHHLLFTSIPNPVQWNWLVLLLSRTSAFGLYGVDLFFVLSGFLITSILLKDRSRPHYYWNFYWKRALRIFPLYIVSLICLAVFLPYTRKYVILAALFLANFAQVFHVDSSGPYWTLAIEEQFYLVWPQFAKRFTASGLQRLALSVVVLGLILRLMDAAIGHHNFRLTFFHLDGLAAGAVLACQRFRRDASGSQGSPGLRRFLLIAGGLLLSALPFFFSPAERIGMAAEALQISGISLLGYGIVRAAVQHTGSRLLAPLRARALTFFGLISYCFYMAHLYVLKLYDHFAGPLQPGDMTRYTVRFFAVLAATVVVCLISRYAIELPAMSLRRYVLRRG